MVGVGEGGLTKSVDSSEEGLGETHYPDNPTHAAPDSLQMTLLSYLVEHVMRHCPEANGFLAQIRFVIILLNWFAKPQQAI